MSKLADVIAQLLGQEKSAKNQAAGLAGLYNSVPAIIAKQSVQDPAFAAGNFAGKIMSGLAKNWANNYQERGALKKEKQANLTKAFKEQYGDRANDAIQDLKNQGIWDRWGKLKDFDPQSYNLPTQSLLGDNATPLTKAADNIRWEDLEEIQGLPFSFMGAR